MYVMLSFICRNQTDMERKKKRPEDKQKTIDWPTRTLPGPPKGLLDPA